MDGENEEVKSQEQPNADDAQAATADVNEAQSEQMEQPEADPELRLERVERILEEHGMRLASEKE